MNHVMKLSRHFSHIVKSDEVQRFTFRGAVSSNINLFCVSDFDINKSDFIDSLSSSFLSLPYDYYDIAVKVEEKVANYDFNLLKVYRDEWLNLWNRIGRREDDRNFILNFWSSRVSDSSFTNSLIDINSYRKRSCFSYTSRKISNYRWEITENGVPEYRQKVDDRRSRRRVWVAPHYEVIQNRYILKLIAVFSEILNNNLAVITNSFEFTFHQMLTIAKDGMLNDPAPEGTHQDGTDYIVSAIVIERENITGGESIIFYAKDENIALKQTLKAGEGIFQADKATNLWHKVTPISRLKKEKEGYRSLIGFDIRLK